jgi:two-component system cell cycle sensor histidine kinase/response regulator CckA
MVPIQETGVKPFDSSERKSGEGDELAAVLKRTKKSESNLKYLLEALATLGPDYAPNIDRLVSLCGEVLDAASVVYFRGKSDTDFAITEWHADENATVDRHAYAEISFEIIKGMHGDFVFVPDLAETNQAAAEAVNRHGRLGACLARRVQAEGYPSGLLCAFFEPDRQDDESARALINSVAGAIEAEERRNVAVEILRRNDERFQALFHNEVFCIFLKDCDLRYTHINPAMERLFGFRSPELVGKTDAELFGEEGAAHCREADLRVLRGEVVEDENTRIVQGARKTFHVVKSPLKTPEGEVVGICGIARNLFGIGDAESALRRSRELLDKILSSSPLGISYVEDGRLKWSNQAMAEMFGYSDEREFLGKELTEFYESPEEYKRILATFFQRLKEGRRAETEAQFKRRDGSTFSGYLRISAPDPSDPRNGTIATISDISARKYAENQLRESEERYRLLTQNSLTGIYIHQDGRFLYVNDRLAEILGYETDELIGKPFWELVHPEDRDLVTQRGMARSLGKQAVAHYEFRALTKQGETRWLEIQATSVTSKGRSANMGNIIDVTERRRADQALRESEERYRGLVEESFDGVFIQKGNSIAFANKRLHEMLGYEDGGLEGKGHWIIYGPGQRENACKRAEMLLSNESASSRYEAKLRRRDGSLFNGEISARSVRFGEEPSIQVWIRDVTDQKRAEQELVRIEKLESTGILAGGIAHDFNNILTAILGNISLARFHTEAGTKAFERLESAEKAAMRARSLTHQLLTFAKGGEPIKKALVITDIVRDSCEFALRGSNVRYEISAPEDLWTVEVDPGQISQVINNLVINADQAMRDGGLIRVELENVAMCAADRPADVLEKYIRITIADSGVGIAPAVLPKIFDPYFTTKEKGSGLGLATAFSVVKSHRGDIRVDSTPGRGTTFYIHLPAALRQSTEESPQEELVRGKGRILLMDDEKSIRQVAGDLLTLLGYSVDFARDGAEAVAMYSRARASAEPFDAVIMDLTVPGGMGGMEAVKRLLALDPDAKVLVSSGYSNDPVMAAYGKYGFRGVVAKPYSAAELSRALEKLSP